MLIHPQNSYVPRGKQRTGRREVQSREPVSEVKVLSLYSVSQEECARLQEGVPYVKIYRYNPKHLCPKLNGYGDNGQRKVRSYVCSANYT
jgi:hypothetical protein